MSEQLPSIFADARERDSFASAISEWFRENARELPWRGAIDPWHVLVSEFMLQQTQVERVWPRFIEWIERWPTPADLANSEPAEALRAWDRLGYPRRALWLHRAAVEITDRFGGVVPSDPAALEQLTGVGPYTARAVSTFAYGERHPVVDTNTRRVLARALHGLAAAGSPSPRDLADQELLLPLDQSAAAEFNAGIMELGAVLCALLEPHHVPSVRLPSGVNGGAQDTRIMLQQSGQNRRNLRAVTVKRAAKLWHFFGTRLMQSLALMR